MRGYRSSFDVAAVAVVVGPEVGLLWPDQDNLMVRQTSAGLQVLCIPLSLMSLSIVEHLEEFVCVLPGKETPNDEFWAL